MQIRVGLSENDLTGRTHRSAGFSSTGGLKVQAVDAPGKASATFPAGKSLLVGVAGSGFTFSGLSAPLPARQGRLRITAADGKSGICIGTLKRFASGRMRAPSYKGAIELSVVGGRLQIVLVCPSDDYLRGVLGSEMPDSYHLEALKAQAVAARTYGLRPRVDHSGEGFNVCDSYLCCQNFTGNAYGINERYARAISSTHDEILISDDKPILAIFSSCAGGHTESFENCFSDPITNQFPLAPLPYLKGVPEGKIDLNLADEQGLRALWAMGKPQTCDAWSPHFKWKVKLSADALELHMHHVVDTMMADPQYKPFIRAPESGQFGHIDSFNISERGVAGTAISMVINTSTGAWTITKELVIRSVFKNPDAGLSRLKSARIFFDHKRDNLGLLSEVTISGFGWGHGVGLQQTGAQGLALAGRNYREILLHYFKGATIKRA